MKKYIVLFLLISSVGFAQNLNNYKYAMVPAKFSFLKEANMYNLNVLTKLFMEKYGFETYFDTDSSAPNDFVNSNCNKVYVDLIENNTVFLTKVKVVVKDCKNNILFTSIEGSSRDKEYKVSYNQALREAFASFDALHHKYDGTTNEVPKVETVVVKETPSEVKSQEIVSVVATNQLYAQPILNGFQLVNTEPKVVYKIYKTSTKDFYIGSKGNDSGVFFLRNNEWFFEYYQSEKLISEKVDVKF